MPKFFIILISSFILAAALERFDYALIGVIVMWAGFLWSVSETPQTHHVNDQGERTMYVIVMSVVLFGISGSILYESLNSQKTHRSVPSNDSNQAEYFYGYECEGDCEGHEAGFDWAKENNIQYSTDCTGNSDSFVEGCEAWIENLPPPFPDRE